MLYLQHTMYRTVTVVVAELFVLLTSINSFALIKPLNHRFISSTNLYCKTDGDSQQWKLYCDNQIGKWIGIQTGYDPFNDEVADYMYTQVETIGSCDDAGKLTSVQQVNSMVSGEIRADCEVCYDSERLKSRVVGTYSIGKLRSKLCSNVELTGPAPTRRGLSTEISITHDNSRMRVLLAYVPIDFRSVEAVGSVPCTMGLTDVVVVRERLGKRPLKLDVGPDVMWQDTADTVFDSCSNYLCNTAVYDSTGIVINKDEIILDTFPVIPTKSSDDMIYTRTLPGGLLINAASVIRHTDPAMIRISWMPEHVNAESDGNVCYSAAITYSALNELVEDENGVRIMPPSLIEFSVDALRKVKG